MNIRFFLLFSLLPQMVWAWGPVGHRAVGVVADELLAISTRQELRKYLPDQNLAEVSNWPDTIKGNSSWSQTYDYHFEKVGDSKTYLQSLKDLPEGERKAGGIIPALLEAQRTFLAPETKHSDKVNALKFIVHFIGDIHQPFHSGRPEDKGGNLVPKTWHGRQTNLHSIWDSYLIAEEYSGESEEDYALYLIEKFDGQKIPGEFDDFNGWLNESMRARAPAYQFKNETEAQYTRRFISVVDQKIYLAGVRLASVLTRLLKRQGPTQTQMNLRSAIENLTGPLRNYISLKPKNLASQDMTTQSADPEFDLSGGFWPDWFEKR